MLYNAIPFLLPLVALCVGYFFRSSPLARGGAILLILATVAFPFVGITASHRVATVRYVASAHQPPPEDYLAGAVAARDAAREQLPFLAGIVIALAILASLPRPSPQGPRPTPNDRNA